MTALEFFMIYDEDNDEEEDILEYGYEKVYREFYNKGWREKNWFSKGKLYCYVESPQRETWSLRKCVKALKGRLNLEDTLQQEALEALEYFNCLYNYYSGFTNPNEFRPDPKRLGIKINLY